MVNTLYMDGLIPVIVEFATKQASDHWVQRMNIIKDEASSIVRRFPHDAVTPVEHRRDTMSVEHLDAMNHWLGMVSGAEKNGVVVPSILAVRDDYLSIVD